MKRFIKVIIAIIVVLFVFIAFAAYEMIIDTHGGLIYTWIKGGIELAVIGAMFAWALRKKESPSDNKGSVSEEAADSDVITVDEPTKETLTDAENEVSVPEKPVSELKDKAEDKKSKTADKIPYIITISLLSIVLVFAVVFSAITITDNNNVIAELKENEDNLNQKISEQSSIIDKQYSHIKYYKWLAELNENNYERLSKRFGEISDELWFHWNTLVYTQDDTMLYHTEDCEEVDLVNGRTNHLSLHDESYAIAKGYKPCPKCH